MKFVVFYFILFILRPKYRAAYPIFRTPNRAYPLFDLFMKKISILPLKFYLQKVSKNKKIYFGFYTHSLGHVLHEFDYVYQLTIIEDTPSILIFEKSLFTQEIQHYFKLQGHKVFTGGLLNYLIGLNFDKLKDYIFLVSLGHEFSYIRKNKYSTLELATKFSNYSDLRFNFNNNKTVWENLSLGEGIFDNLNLNKNQKYVTVQIKTSRANQNIVESNLNLYFKVLKTLNNLGYKIILMGREKKPAEWGNLDLIDYANSKFVSFSNDLCLIKYSNLNLSTASGFFLLADMLHVPSCVVNVWQILWPPFDSNTVFLPQLLMHRGSLVSFNEQVHLNFIFSTHRESEIAELLKNYKPIELPSSVIIATVKDILENNYNVNITLRDQVTIPPEYEILPLNFIESKISNHVLLSYPEYARIKSES